MYSKTALWGYKKLAVIGKWLLLRGDRSWRFHCNSKKSVHDDNALLSPIFHQVLVYWCCIYLHKLAFQNRSTDENTNIPRGYHGGYSKKRIWPSIDTAKGKFQRKNKERKE